MFGLFKKKNLSKSDKLAALIKKQTAFSIKALALHKKLRAAPDKKKAIFEAFLFNNWISFHLITRELCASLPASTPQSDVEATRADIAQRLIIAAYQEGTPALEKAFDIQLSDYCKNGFSDYALSRFFGYDSSVSRHQTPAWLSAAIRLGVCAELPLPDFSDFERSMAEQLETQKEAAGIFIALDDLIRNDVHDYVRTS